MPRPKSFDVDEALDAAINCFWRDGLKAASTRELAEQMGIAGPSLYNTFGCKRELFAQALERYAEGKMRPALSSLEAQHGPKGAVRALVLRTIEKVLQKDGPVGCLLINAAIEVDPEDTIFCTSLSGYIDEFAGFFLRNLQAAQEAGELSTNLDPYATAQMLLSVMIGISVLARSRPDRALLEAAARPALAILETPTTEKNST